MKKLIILLKFDNEENKKYCERKLKAYLKKFITHLKIKSFEIHNPLKNNKIIGL